MNISNFIEELKRRNVFKVAVAYAIAGWLIIQIFATIAPQLGFPDWVAPLVTTLVLIGFPLALIFAWAFELTPEGIQKSKEVDITESVTASTGKKLNGIIISILSIAVFFLVIERVFFATSGMVDVDQSSISNASIAVLPFADLSPDGDQEYFSDGLSEELLNVLTKAEEMRVAGRTSSFKFKGQNENLKLIGAELDVDHILEGSVRKAGNTIRITAQLIKVEDGFQVWSETYDREYTAENVFRIQDEISQMVLNELKVRLLTSENSEALASTKEIPTSDIEAYEAYLRGTELLRNRKPDEIKLAIEQFERASELDPTFAEAFGYISFSYARLHEYGNIDKEQMEELIRYNSDRALFINTEIPRAYAGLSYLFRIKEDTTNAINAIKKAYELNPKDAEMVNSYANMLWLYQALNDKYADKSDSLYKVAYSLDPLNPVIANNMATAMYREEDFDKVIELLDRNIDSNPEYLLSYTNKIRMLKLEPNGKLDEAFMAAYQGYNENRESLDFIEEVIGAALDFDLDSLAATYKKEILRLYPNNEAAENIRRNVLWETFDSYRENKDYDKAQEFAEENLTFIDLEDADWDERISSIKINDYIEDQEYEKAIQLLKEESPIYFTDTLTVHPVNFWRSKNVEFLFRKAGYQKEMEELQRLILEKPFEFPEWAAPQFDENIKEERSQTLNIMANKYANLNDPKKIAEIINEIYFVRKAKTYRWDGRWDNARFEGLRDHPDLAPILKRVEEDKQRMKDNVIAFLKDEGVWKEEWEEEDN